MVQWPSVWREDGGGGRGWENEREGREGGEGKKDTIMHASRVKYTCTLDNPILLRMPFETSGILNSTPY